ncbi:MAG: allophanate hydrolase subunit 1 [Solirubrobacteraceae bacterium]|nr:allophanate hydrolase subunit 1 [Patulibacter sp.]
MTIRPGIRPAGDRAVLVELPGNATVRKLARLVPRGLAGIDEVVAGHETVLISWEPGRRPPVDLEARLSAMLSSSSTEGEGGSIDVPVVYDGPDLAAVAEHAGVSPEEVVRRHLASRFEVGFVGFAPGFAYLLGGDPSLRPPRLDEPRTKVPAGSLAIAGEYSAVYPSESPGGWNLIGRALIEPFDLHRDPPALLQTGMHVHFVESS